MTNKKTTAESEVQSSKTWDPLVRQILEEVALDPKSRLLRVPERCEVPGDEPVRASKSSLTQVERYLVDVHRFEVAFLLLEEAQRVSLARNKTEAHGHVGTWMTPDQHWSPSDPQEWEERSHYRISATRKGFVDPNALSLLERCVQSSPGERPSSSQLALASQRLVPRAETKICLALSQHQDGKTKEALSLLHEVIDKGTSELCLSCAWENVGLLQDVLGHRPLSLEAYTKASSTLESRQMPLMYLIFVAFQLGDELAVLRASNILGDLVSEDHPSVLEYVSCSRGERASGIWQPTPEALRMFNRIGDRLEGAARIVANDFS